MKKKYELIVIGGSAGSFQVILKLVSQLDKGFDIPVLIITHRSRGNDTQLIDILNEKTSLRVKEAEEKELILPGCIYVCPPDYHLLIEKDKTLSLDYSEKVHYARPSIDVTFQCVADIYKEKSIAVLLSGANGDGAEGLYCIHQQGGVTIVQDPKNAEVPLMPQRALELFTADYIIEAKEIAGTLKELST
ncbi:MAG: chemotaxis protein CheB [Chitinophagaceae bacterium]